MPKQTTAARLAAFLEQNPDIEVFEVILPDLSGGLRGKWVYRDKIHRVFDGKFKMPVSSLAFDAWGRDPEELVFDSGDGDGYCEADIDTLVRVPWAERPTGQVLLSMNEINGDPCGNDTRHLLKRLMARFEVLGLTPVLATEMEFSLFRAEDDHKGQPQHSHAHTLGAGQTYGIELMEDMSELMHAIRDACDAQGLPIDTLIKEAAPSQYEINLYHNDNALKAADQGLMLKRVIRSVAKRFGYRATFMAKPFGDLAGNGMHMHCSLVNKDGSNAFDNGTEQGNELLQQAIAGCLESMADVMLLLAPHLNSYRRFQRGSHAPLAPTWGYENRTVSVRVPTDSLDAMRIEHRVAGADASCHLAVAAILSGILHGIENTLSAPAPVEGNAYDQFPPSLPRYWSDALTIFSQSDFIERYLGAEMRRAIGIIKQQEMDEFDRQVTALEYSISL